MKKVCSLSFSIRTLLVLLVVTVSLSFTSPATATDRKDLLVALKTLPMLDNALSGSVSMAIIYDPANAQSKADAEAIKSTIDEGLDQGISQALQVSSSLRGPVSPVILTRVLEQEIAPLDPWIQDELSSRGTGLRSTGTPERRVGAWYHSSNGFSNPAVA